MQRICLLLPLASALLAPISPAARSIAVRPSSYLDNLEPAAPAAAKPAASYLDAIATAAPAAATKPAPAPVAAAPAPVAEKPAPAPTPAPVVAPAPAPAAAPATPVAGDVPAVIVGSGGRIGGMLLKEGDAAWTSTSGWPADAPKEGPIYVCTRNDVLEGIIAATPENRRQDLCFLQNGMLGPFLEAQELNEATQVLMYVAVAKKGEEPTDGITDANPEGLTTATGKWADAFRARLVNQGLTCHVKNGDAFTVAMLEKHVWICAFMLVGATHGCTVGEVESTHAAEFDKLATEMMTAGAAALNVEVADGFLVRLKAYARAVAHFPTAVKEFEWRNGWFYKLTCDAVKGGKEDPLPLHTQALYDLKLPLPIAWIE